MKLTLHIKDPKTDAWDTLSAILDYLNHPDLPQYYNLGKRNGGIAMVYGRAFWVWRTKTGWHAEVEE